MDCEKSPHPPPTPEHLPHARKQPVTTGFRRGNSPTYQGNRLETRIETAIVTPGPQDIDPSPAVAGLGRLAPLLQWAILIVASVALAGFLELIGLPAALFLGPMVAAVFFGVNGGTIRLPRPLYLGAQALVGVMVAGSIDAGILPAFLANWPLFLAVVVSVILLSTLSGWILSKRRILPGTTAIWGTSAGAASSMLLMAEAFGADVRLVAFMQYLRVVTIASVATLVAHVWAGGVPQAVQSGWFSVSDTGMFLTTLALTLFGALAGKVLRIPAGTFLVPFIAGALLNASGHIDIELPGWLTTLSFAMIGWRIGLVFTRPILDHARRAFVPVFVSIIVLLAFCGLLALLLHRFAGVDALTAYLATSPGGLETVAIIAASSNVDLAFVMTLQTARLLLIMAFGPPLARFVAGKAEGAERKI